MLDREPTPMWDPMPRRLTAAWLASESSEYMECDNTVYMSI